MGSAVKTPRIPLVNLGHSGVAVSQRKFNYIEKWQNQDAQRFLQLQTSWKVLKDPVKRSEETNEPTCCRAIVNIPTAPFLSNMDDENWRSCLQFIRTLAIDYECEHSCSAHLLSQTIIKGDNNDSFSKYSAFSHQRAFWTVVCPFYVIPPAASMRKCLFR